MADVSTDIYTKSHEGLCQLIATYRGSLPSYAQLDPQAAIDVYLCHALINGAEMRIRGRFKDDTHQQQCILDAAKAVFDIPGGETVQEPLGFVTPVLGVSEICILAHQQLTTPRRRIYGLTLVSLSLIVS